MFDNLRKNLEKALQTLKGQGRITEINIATTVKEIRRALIKADVHYKIAKQVTDRVKEKALGKNVLTTISPGQLFTKIIHEELTGLMGHTNSGLTLTGQPAVILMAGLQGTGKTTLAGKLALHLKKQHKQVLLVACDVYRPAAIEQLQLVGQQAEVAVYTVSGATQPQEIAQKAIQYATTQRYDIVIIDTAGRLAADDLMMQEITQLKEVTNPVETLFVADAMMGQDAIHAAQTFHAHTHFDGIVLTKLDGDARGGAALSISTVVKKPIKLIGTGEKLTDLAVFYPERMANRILGMGDVVSLVEKAEEVYNKAQQRQLTQKASKNILDFNDFLTQLQQLKKMGRLKDLSSMLPGIHERAAFKGKTVDDDTFKPFEAMIHSMTPQERTHPHWLDKSRRTRIAHGSGMTVLQVNQLIKQFEQMRKMMYQLSRGGKQHIAHKLMKL